MLILRIQRQSVQPVIWGTDEYVFTPDDTVQSLVLLRVPSGEYALSRLTIYEKDILPQLPFGDEGSWQQAISRDLAWFRVAIQESDSLPILLIQTDETFQPTVWLERQIATLWQSDEVLTIVTSTLGLDEDGWFLRQPWVEPWSRLSVQESDSLSVVSVTIVDDAVWLQFPVWALGTSRPIAYDAEILSIVVSFGLYEETWTPAIVHKAYMLPHVQHGMLGWDLSSEGGLPIPFISHVIRRIFLGSVTNTGA